MSDRDTTKAPASASDFAEQAEQDSPGLFGEFWYFLTHNKKWWLTPIILVLLVMGIVVALGASPAAPFIYTLF